MHRKTWQLQVALATLTCFAFMGLPLHAQISIQATSITSGNQLFLTGLGDLGGGVGHTIYQLGSCAYDGTSRTSCTVSGSYMETAGSLNPGATGTFTWQMSWAGSGPSPIQSRSVTPGSNTMVLHYVPSGAFFELFLGNGLYANLDPGSPDTPNPTGGQLNWQAFAAPSAQCTGVANCSVGQVGLTAGATLTSPLSPFNLQLTYPGTVPPLTSVPEPGTLALMAAGLAMTGVWGSRRRRHAATRRVTIA